MADLPAGPTYGKIVYRALIARGDGTDAGTLPDAVPASGTVTFTPSADSFVIAGSVPPVTVFPETITCTFNSAGDLIDPQNQVGVWLIATDSPSTNPTGFTYKVKIAIDGIAKPKQFDIAVPGGVTRDLSVVGPVGTSNGVLITKGDKGDPGANGAPGAKGDKGDKGDPGTPGTPGASTIDGVSGLQGALDDKMGKGYGDLPAGSTITVSKSGASWPPRPTNRADVTVMWKGADPSPSIVSSGTSGMRDGVDIRLVTP